jgi:DNA replication protein DnaC
MEAINNLTDRVNRILATTKANGSPQKIIEYNCPICKDAEWIISPSGTAASPCKCQESKRYKAIMDNSGISDVFLKMTFLNYIPKDKAQDIAKKKAMEYARDFEKIRSTRQNSIMFCKQVGSGKTHLSIAICNELMNQFVGIRYMPYKEVINYLKQIKTDEESYQREVYSYKNAPVLMIDDLFKLSERKGQVNEADLDIIYEIVNARYIKSMPMIISTEYDTDKLLETDQATGSRIIEMCKGRIVEFEGIQLNDRLR